MVMAHCGIRAASAVEDDLKLSFRKTEIRDISEHCPRADSGVSRQTACNAGFVLGGQMGEIGWG